jgi:hypothetical protein
VYCNYLVPMIQDNQAEEKKERERERERARERQRYYGKGGQVSGASWVPSSSRARERGGVERGDGFWWSGGAVERAVARGHMTSASVA